MSSTSSATGRNPADDFDVITRELELFAGGETIRRCSANKPRIAAANKIDAMDDPERLRADEAPQATEGTAHPIQP